MAGGVGEGQESARAVSTLLPFLIWEKSDESPEKSGDPFGPTDLWGGCGTGISQSQVARWGQVGPSIQPPPKYPHIIITSDFTKKLPSGTMPCVMCSDVHNFTQ